MKQDLTSWLSLQNSYDEKGYEQFYAGGIVPRERLVIKRKISKCVIRTESPRSIAVTLVLIACISWESVWNRNSLIFSNYCESRLNVSVCTHVHMHVCLCLCAYIGYNNLFFKFCIWRTGFPHPSHPLSIPFMSLLLFFKLLACSLYNHYAC